MMDDRYLRLDRSAARPLRPLRARLLGLVLALALAVAAPGANLSHRLAYASTASGALFLRKIPSAILDNQTDSMSVAVDAAGGMHAAFANLSTDTNGYYHAYYDYCAPASDCAGAANWTFVPVLTVSNTLTIMDATQIALDPQGRPRLLIVTTDNGGNFKDHYNYAACDAACTNGGNWTVSDVADMSSGSNTFIFDGNKHFFALDPQGRPRFVVDNGIHYVYVYCDTACTNDLNWNALTLNGSSGTGMGFNTPALAFNAAGKPRLLAPLTDQNTFQTNLDYWECNAADCSTNANSWTSAGIITPMGGSAALYSSLRLTRTGQPRFAYYGALSGPADSLFYFWCSSACTSDANWSFSGVGLAPASGFNTSGQEPDLALDGQDHPRLSFQTLDNTLGHGLGYARCDTNCESNSATWQKVLADSNDQLNADWNRLPPAGCSYSSWVGGYRSALVLDTAGNPRIGYDAEHSSGQCSDPKFNGEDYKTVRFVYFPASTSRYIYLPLLQK